MGIQCKCYSMDIRSPKQLDKVAVGLHYFRSVTISTCLQNRAAARIFSMVELNFFWKVCPLQKLAPPGKKLETPLHRLCFSWGEEPMRGSNTPPPVLPLLLSRSRTGVGWQTTPPSPLPPPCPKPKMASCFFVSLCPKPAFFSLLQARQCDLAQDRAAASFPLPQGQSGKCG